VSHGSWYNANATYSLENFDFFGGEQKDFFSRLMTILVSSPITAALFFISYEHDIGISWCKRF
jgi:hypothetical protein